MSIQPLFPIFKSSPASGLISLLLIGTFSNTFALFIIEATGEPLSEPTVPKKTIWLMH